MRWRRSAAWRPGGGDTTLAGSLIAAAGACRDETGYRFRFGYEQVALDEAAAIVGAASLLGPALGWEAAADAGLVRARLKTL